MENVPAPDPSMIAAPPTTNSSSQSQSSPPNSPLPPPWEKQIPLKWIFLLLTVVLVLLAIISILITSGVKIGLPLNNSKTSNPKVAQTTPPPTPPAAPLTEPLVIIQPLIKECLFPYYGGCVTRIGNNFINQNNKYEDYANVDIPYILSFHQQSTLITFRETLPPTIRQAYFPEVTDPNRTFTASEIIQRIAMKENINPRVLLTLFEVLQNGQGVLLSGTRHPQLALTTTPTSFASQLGGMAKELKTFFIKYDVLLQDGQPFPATLKYYSKTYTVGTPNTPGSLAIVEFLANRIKDKNQFERAVVVQPKEETLENNFVELYEKLYQVDPVQNVPAGG